MTRPSAARRCTRAPRDWPTTSPSTSRTRCASAATSSGTSTGARPGPGPAQAPRPPLYDPEELLGIASADIKVPFEAREVLARVLDASEFDEFKPLYGTTLVTGWGHVNGYPVGILANNGILFSEEAHKGAQFIQLCNRMDVPILFLQNITGFMVGTRYEQGGIIKDGAKLINAVSNCGVPMITLMMGASYGAGNYGMAGRAYDPRFIFSWPNHRIAVMGPKQLAGVLTIVARQKTEAAGQEWDEEAFAPIRDAFEKQVEDESTALFATGRLVGRRDHRPARHPDGAHHGPVGRALRPRSGHGLLRRLPDVMTVTDTPHPPCPRREPRRDRRPRDQDLPRPGHPGGGGALGR